MPSAEYDLRYLHAGVEQLEAYLLASGVYWPPGISAPAGETPYPQLTLGNLLLSRQRARATAQEAAQRAELERLEREMETMRSQWRSAWGKKATAEFSARLSLWRNFMEEYRQEPAREHDRYAYEVGRRVLLHLLAAEAEELPEAEVEMLAGLDAILRATLVPGAFVWDAELAPAFPAGIYWYLYGTVPE
jgi:hypothetical protein